MPTFNCGRWDCENWKLGLCSTYPCTNEKGAISEDYPKDEGDKSEREDS